MEIVLATLNARYSHASMGLRYLFANLGELQSRAIICEFTIQQSPLEIVEELLRHSPLIVGLGVYIWNVQETEQVVSLLRQLQPSLIIVLGGPEVSYDSEQQPICQLADYVICGEGDLEFKRLCDRLLGHSAYTEPQQLHSPSLLPVVTAPHRPTILHAPVPDLSQVELPYSAYTNDDLAHRIVYVEASRGCPFTCEFCLSALDIPVRQFALAPFLDAMQKLLDRGLRTFKFVDRTFNLNLRVSRAILQFFLDRMTTGFFLHFEMIPDRLPEGLRELILQFPPGSLQFEVGIQTWNDDVAVLISRRQDNAVAETNLRWLREKTGVHLHTDLIVGLPGEDITSFAQGFNRLVACQPHEIQVGILKRLRGTPIVRHDTPWQMVYSPHPPYEILQTRLIDFPQMQDLRRFAKTWDLVANSGNFVETVPWFWQRPMFAETGAEMNEAVTNLSPFAEMLAFSRWLYQQTQRTHGIALPRLLGLVFTYLTEVAGHSPTELAPIVLRDYERGGRSDTPAILRPWLTAQPSQSRLSSPSSGTVAHAPKERAGTSEPERLLPPRQTRWHRS